MAGPSIECDHELSLRAVPGVPRVQPGDDVAALLLDALEAAAIPLSACDVLVVSSKLFSRAAGRFTDLSGVRPDARARELAERTGKDPALVQCILEESVAVSRAAPGVLIVRHRLCFVSANAGLDASNARPQGAAPNSGPWVLRLPEDPDAEANRLRERLETRFGGPLGVVISDSHGRPFRVGSVGIALGVAGLPPVYAQAGRLDLDARALEHTHTATADALASAADLVAGQADEGRPAVRVRGLRFDAEAGASARTLLRPVDQDLYA